MKQTLSLKSILTFAAAAVFGNMVNAQCSFTGLDSMYCADAESVTLTGTPEGGTFVGAGMTDNIFDPAAAGPGTHVISYESFVEKENYYLRAQVGEPWSSSSNTDAMDMAFGAGEWLLGEFETLDPAAVFSSATGFVFIDGSDNGAAELNDFLTANITTIENWVNDGGRLLLNAAPNEGSDMDFGFDGTTLVYADASSSVDVVDLTHPAYVGPNTPTASTMTGGSYSHAHITGTGYTSVLTQTGDATNIVLCEKSWGAGQVMMGGMTTPNFHSPATEALNWRANLLVYMANATSKFYLRATAGDPWGSSSNIDAMNLAFGAGQWSTEFFETLDPATVFSSTTSVVFIDGSDGGAIELNDFLTANITLIEEWVMNGGSLLMNAAPNEGGDMDFGFDGTTLVYADASSSVDVTDLTHPAYLGPLTPTAATMTGSSYSHAHITGSGYAKLLTQTGDTSNVVLCEKAWGEGMVIMGGMTTPNFHSPATEALNWRANLLAYLSDQFDGYLCVAEQEVVVLDPITIDVATTDEISGEDGSIDITVTGGWPAYSFDWDNDGTGDFDDTEDLADVEAGTYVVMIEDEFGCTATETVVVNSQVSIAEEQLAVTLFPNPTQGNITVQVSGEFNYELMDLNGKVIFTGKAVNQQILDLSSVENGVYFVRILAGDLMKTAKIVKK